MKITFSKKAEKQSNKIPDHIFDHVLTKIQDLANQTGVLNIRKLTNREGFRLRVGDYRIIYKVEPKQIVIRSIAHRKDAYRHF